MNFLFVFTFYFDESFQNTYANIIVTVQCKLVAFDDVGDAEIYTHFTHTSW